MRSSTLYVVQSLIVSPRGHSLWSFGFWAAVRAALPSSVVVVPELRGDVDGRLGRLLAGEELEGQDDTGAGDGRRVGHGRTLEARLIEELGDEAGVVRADDRHERVVGGLHGVDDRRVNARGPDAVERARRCS